MKDDHASRLDAMYEQEDVRQVVLTWLDQKGSEIPEWLIPRGAARHHMASLNDSMAVFILTHQTFRIDPYLAYSLLLRVVVGRWAARSTADCFRAEVPRDLWWCAPAVGKVLVKRAWEETDPRSVRLAVTIGLDGCRVVVYRHTPNASKIISILLPERPNPGWSDPDEPIAWVKMRERLSALLGCSLEPMLSPPPFSPIGIL